MSGRRIAGLVIAVALIGLGGLWTAQGLGWTGGERVESLAILGPLVAGIGCALGWTMIRPPER